MVLLLCLSCVIKHFILIVLVVGCCQGGRFFIVLCFSFSKRCMKKQNRVLLCLYCNFSILMLISVM